MIIVTAISVNEEGFTGVETQDGLYTEPHVISLLTEVEAGQTESFFAADDIDDPSVINNL